MELLSLSSMVSFFQNTVFSLSNLYQLITLGIGLSFAKIASFFVKKVMQGRFFPTVIRDRYKKNIPTLIFPILCCLIQWVIVAASREFHWDFWLNHAAAVVMIGWVCVRFISLFIMPSGLRKLVTFAIYSITVLQILGLLSHLLVIMESSALSIGELQISFLSFLKGGAILFFLIWGTSIVSNWARKRVKKISRFEPALQELFLKLIRISFLAFSLLITLSSMGLNLSVFAVFGGAIGVGIGFGLQKVISNLICGIILLLDRSIKPGDVIALKQGKSYGEINKLGARYVSVRTRSGKEHLIPNEDFIINRSENWSLTDSYIRLRLPMRASLDADVNLVMKLLVDAAEGVERVVKSRPPAARLRSFSESAIEFELRIWINDPQNGLSKVKSDIYINIWNLFTQHGIAIPYPHRNVHIFPSSEHPITGQSNSFSTYANCKDSSL